MSSYKSTDEEATPICTKALQVDTEYLRNLAGEGGSVEQVALKQAADEIDRLCAENTSLGDVLQEDRKLLSLTEAAFDAACARITELEAKPTISEEEIAAQAIGFVEHPAIGIPPVTERSRKLANVVLSVFLSGRSIKL